MPQYAIDYLRTPSATEPPRKPQEGGRSGRSRLALVGLWVGTPSLLLLVVCALSAWQLHTENRVLRQAHDLHRLRFDSLLSAKVEADRQLHLMLRHSKPTDSNRVLIRP